MKSLRVDYLQHLGVTVWLRRVPQDPGTVPFVVETAVVEKPVVSPEANTNALGGAYPPEFEALRVEVAACARCDLYQQRTQTVFGMGNPYADLLIIGEAPGADEDRQGLPFVGRAGKLLDEMLFAVGLSREQIFIANVLKCRPPDNRNPQADEVASCANYLKRQIEMIAPRFILLLGRIAAHHLLNVQDSLGRLRQQSHFYGNIPVIVTYHPAYLLRSPQEKAKAWEDLNKMQKLYTR